MGHWAMGTALEKEDPEECREWGGLGSGGRAPGLSLHLLSCPLPQMWACALGHLEAAVLLFRWNRQALSIPDSLGRLPLSVAHSRGHVRLARCLEELQRQEASVEPPLALSPPSSSPDTGEGGPNLLERGMWVGGKARAKPKGGKRVKEETNHRGRDEITEARTDRETDNRMAEAGDSIEGWPWLLLP